MEIHTVYTVSIAGASGYTGMETLRYLSGHPAFRLGNLYGESSAGKQIEDIYPAFTSVLEREILPIAEITSDTSDAMILALPHGMSADVVRKLLDAGYKGKIIDIGSDFRLKSVSDYEQYYKSEHPHPDLLEQFVYGLPEFNRGEVRDSDYVANPGCFATALQLAVIPLARAGLIEQVYATGITGSSGSGAGLSSTTQFSTRFANVRAYKVFSHQHMGEVNQNIRSVTGFSPVVHFTPVSGPLVRGIWVTVSGTLTDEGGLTDLFESQYYNAPLVRLRDGLPELKPVAGTAFADIGWHQQGRHFVVGSAIDNMGKGAAGQMFQNLNLMFGLPEDTGLLIPGIVL